MPDLPIHNSLQYYSKNTHKQASWYLDRTINTAHTALMQIVDHIIYLEISSIGWVVPVTAQHCQAKHNIALDSIALHSMISLRWPALYSSAYHNMALRSIAFHSSPQHSAAKQTTKHSAYHRVQVHYVLTSTYQLPRQQLQLFVSNNQQLAYPSYLQHVCLKLKLKLGLKLQHTMLHSPPLSPNTLHLLHTIRFLYTVIKISTNGTHQGRYSTCILSWL